MTNLITLNNATQAVDFRDSPVVLVVDDEPVIRSLLDRALRASGFQPILARSGREALEVYAEQKGDIDLVLLDVRMPELNGPETFQALLQLDPEVRCCFMSGDLGGYTADELRAEGALHLFTKPFPVGEPAATLRRLTNPDD